MKIIISETKIKELGKFIETLINSELDIIRSESDDWGLGEMEDIMELESIDKITVDRVVPYIGTTVYVTIHINKDRDLDYQNIMSELRYRLGKWIPNVRIFIDSII